MTKSDVVVRINIVVNINIVTKINIIVNINIVVNIIIKITRHAVGKKCGNLDHLLFFEAQRHGTVNRLLTFHPHLKCGHHYRD